MPSLPSSDSLVSSSPDKQQMAWDRRYREKGRQWGNAPAEFIQTLPCGTVLELGVGDGKNLRVRDSESCLCIGLDFSPAALQICRTDPELSDVHLLLGDVCKIPVRSTQVNFVYAHHILGHLSSSLQPLLMDEIFRVLRPGGTLALTVFASGDMRDGQGREVDQGIYLRGDGIITRYFTPDEIKSLGKQFIILAVNREEWFLTIKGKKYLRAVLTALLKKSE
ncbi:MAG TPA: class I SAM-dependent methyltransferase [Methanospirillum sp.]|uniref:class I SAM-dependent methyltransferase n=1 Tax=Methanospirillum sp. TaxID=45200 RepID=UPI002D1422FF|nr:class I SAM-dependent methyltransferase [Methanospirillum sp.]HWQ63528.1 class I SAM-dependent methyltransferase [Methanospirillum sp.]